MPVKVVVLEERPIEDTSEFLANLSSRTSVTLYPQVVGKVARILARPGIRVKAGTPLVEIDSREQKAELDQIVASRASREAAARLAEIEAERARRLFEEGAISQSQHDVTVTQAETTAADVRALDAQIATQRALLKYYTLVAPFDGVVGDIPIKIGDLVTTTTAVTTIDETDRLEVYVNVPVNKAGAITPETRVQLRGDGEDVLAESTLVFVADRANAATQSVLTKGYFPNTKELRVAQLVRARVIWGTYPGIRVPVTSVRRQAGQAFVFIAEQGEKGEVAKQRPIKLGPIVENDYALREGLRPGERLIVTALQKLVDGMPIRVEP